MAKSKSKAVVMAADGTGGMAQVHDHRFDPGDWPIRFDVPKEQVDNWLQYFSSECGKRGWGYASLGQMEAKENSGSVNVTTGAAGQSQLVVVWERKRGGPIKISARLEGVSEFTLADAQGLFRKVNELCETGFKERFYFRGQLQYQGLPLRGELWLGDLMRLGPPAKQYEMALLGPRVILIDAQIDGIDQLDANSAFAVKLRELSVFLSVVMMTEVRVPINGRRAWTWTAGAAGKVECDVRDLGYLEMDYPSAMPAKGFTPQVPLVPVQRPDFALRGIRAGDTERQLPADIFDLWQAFTDLPPDRRQQFLRVGSLWQLGLSHGHEYQTAGFTYMVAACEALKPPGLEFRDHNIYHVVEALLGKQNADVLQEQWFRPQDVRNAHLHRGEFRGSEFVQHVMMSSFSDPTFDQAHRILRQITPAAIIEWLRLSGTFTMPPLKRRWSWRRWVKKHASLLLILTTVSVAGGIALGWLLGMVWTSR